MPQMSPMNWFFLFFLFNFSLFLMMVKMYNIFNKILLKKESTNFHKNMFLLKL